MHSASGTSVRLRPAIDADSRRIWEWRNEAAARAASFNTDMIPIDVHTAWFARVLEGAGPQVLVASDAEGKDIGYVRFDIEGDTAEISVCLDQAHRNRGVGRRVIRDSALLLIREHHLHRIVALVKPGNEASLAAFTSAGFVVRGRQRRGGVDAWALEFAEAERADP